MPRIIIDTEKCKNCGICMEVCPKGLIKVSKHTNRQGNITVEFKDEQSACIGCAMCAISCPEIAIKEVLK